jgi:hypothetical protein
VRNFGMGGLLINTTSSTLPNYVFMETVGGGSPVGWRASSTGLYYGRDPLNNLVIDNATFWGAVAMIRGPYGRKYLIPGQTGNAGGSVTWVYPPTWAQVDINMGTTDVSYNGAEMTGNPNDTVNRLAQMGIATLGVEFLPCNNFAFTSMDPTTAGYWGERWELYKHTYVVAGWSWKRAMQKIEFWNEVRARALQRLAQHWPDALCSPARSPTWAACPASTAPPGWSTSRCAAWPSSTRTPTSTPMWRPTWCRAPPMRRCLVSTWAAPARLTRLWWSAPSPTPA